MLGLRTVVHVACHQLSLGELGMMLGVFVMSVASFAHALTIKQWFDSKHAAKHRKRHATGIDVRAERQQSPTANGVSAASDQGRLVPLGHGSWLYRIEQASQPVGGEQPQGRDARAAGVLLLLMVLPQFLFALALVISNALRPSVPARRGMPAGRGRKLEAGAHR